MRLDYTIYICDYEIRMNPTKEQLTDLIEVRVQVARELLIEYIPEILEKLKHEDKDE